MGRLIDTDNLIGCAIIKPMTSEEFEHILACENKIVHDDIPTAYDVEAVVKQIEEKAFPDFEEEYSCNGEQLVWLSDVLEIVRRGGVK